MPNRSSKRRGALRQQVAAIRPVDGQGFTVETRDALPAHFLVKIESFSALSKHEITEYETTDFAAGGYKWRLVIYLDDDNHVSVQFALAETTSLPTGWEVNAMFSFFLYNQISDSYLCFRGIMRRFHAMKSQWRLSKLITQNSLMDPSNGYIVDDKCVFGAEVHVIKSEYVTEHLLLKDLVPYKREWEILGFSKLNDVWISENFTVGDCEWNIQLYPKGDSREKGRSISIFLYCVDLSSKKVKADYCITIRGQLNVRNKSRNASHWFMPSSKDWGWSAFAPVAGIIDPKKGYVVNDQCVVEIELSVRAVSSSIAP